MSRVPCPVAAALALAMLLLGVPQLSEPLTAQPNENALRTVDPGLTVALDLGPEGSEGRVLIELNPTFAPKHSMRFLELVRSGFYDGVTFYRVIEGFVAQGGDGSDIQGELEKPMIDAEFERAWSNDQPFTPVQEKDLFAESTGFSQGFAVGLDAAKKTAWLLHCPGTVAMARNNGRDSASTDFYIVLGQAPRYLDRNMSIFGRVIAGMDAVQRIRRGPRSQDGLIEDEAERTLVSKARVLADLPSEERLSLLVTNTESASFARTLEQRRNRAGEFFHTTPPPVLDVCQVPLSSEIR